MKILITAGPTREPIDPVRFISNRSSGKMGYAVAEVAVGQGHEVILISGPVSLNPPKGVKVIQVITAEDMCAAVENKLKWCHALVMCAAVADWRPAVISSRKIKKSGTAPVIHLEPTPDILKKVLPKKGKRLFVGFAAETDNLEEEARRKLREKNLDLIVANDVSATDAGFEVDNNRVILIARTGKPESLPLMPKKKVAGRILKWIETRT